MRCAAPKTRFERFDPSMKRVTPVPGHSLNEPGHQPLVDRFDKTVNAFHGFGLFRFGRPDTRNSIFRGRDGGGSAGGSDKGFGHIIPEGKSGG